MALTFGLTRSIRLRHASVTSAAESSLARIMAASSVAVREQMPSLPAGTGVLSTDDGRYVRESGEALFGDHGAYSFLQRARG